MNKRALTILISIGFVSTSLMAKGHNGSAGDNQGVNSQQQQQQNSYTTISLNIKGQVSRTRTRTRDKDKDKEVYNSLQNLISQQPMARTY